MKYLIVLILIFIGLNLQAQENPIEHIHYIDSSMVYTADTVSSHYIFAADSTIGYMVLTFDYNYGGTCRYETSDYVDIKTVVKFLTMIYGISRNLSDCIYFWNSDALHTQVYLMIYADGGVGFEMHGWGMQ